MVIEAIREIVRNEEYAQAIKKRIGVQIDTKAVDKELEGYQAKLKEVDLNKQDWNGKLTVSLLMQNTGNESSMI